MSLIDFMFDDPEVGVETHTLADARDVYESSGMNVPKGLRSASPGPTASVEPSVTLAVPHASVLQLRDDEEVEVEEASENDGLDDDDHDLLGSEYIRDDRLDGRDMMSGRRPVTISIEDYRESLPSLKKPSLPPTVKGFAATQSPFGETALVGQSFGPISTGKASGTQADFVSIRSARDRLDLLVPTHTIAESSTQDISQLIDDADVGLLKGIADYVITKRRIGRDFEQLKRQCEEFKSENDKMKSDKW